jgi:hypothetical protein
MDEFGALLPRMIIELTHTLMLCTAAELIAP